MSASTWKLNIEQTESQELYFPSRWDRDEETDSHLSGSIKGENKGNILPAHSHHKHYNYFNQWRLRQSLEELFGLQTPDNSHSPGIVYDFRVYVALYNINWQYYSIHI